MSIRELTWQIKQVVLEAQKFYEYFAEFTNYQSENL